jgi:folate-binding protein YgfZ
MPLQTPLYDVEARVGGAFEEVAGWLIPVHYGNPASEDARTRQTAGLFDLCHHGKVTVTGPEAARFLHNLCTNSVTTLAAGDGCEAYLTTGQARIVARALIYHLPAVDGTPAFWLDVGPGLGPKVYQHLDHFLVSEQVELADRTEDMAQLHLAGPRAAVILNQALGAELPPLKELQHAERTVQGQPCQVRRHDPLGLPGFDLVAPRTAAQALWEALTAAGAVPAGLPVYGVLRLEAGTPENGPDIDGQLPQEVRRMERAVSFTKGCYIGQETVARIRTYGHVNRSLVGLRVAGEEALLEGTKLFRDGQEVGQATSSVLSPRHGLIALAYVRRGSEKPGTVLDVGAAGSGRTAEVVSLPFAGADRK